MECLRFGNNIPGEYHGCCAGDIFQNFNQDPRTPASIQLVCGDSGTALIHGKGAAFLGPTLEDIFWQRLRVSTFGTNDMPNHFFLAVLEESQIAEGAPGRKWLKLLKQAGFEFLRTVDNSVYTGHVIGGHRSPHRNYVFGLFRNIGGAKIEDPFCPPKAWTDLPTAAPEQWELLENATTDRLVFVDEQREAHLKIWNDHGPTKIMTETEVVKAGAPVIMAGLRSEFPPQLKDEREERMKKRRDKTLPYSPPYSGVSYLYPDAEDDAIFCEYDDCDYCEYVDYDELCVENNPF